MSEWAQAAQVGAIRAIRFPAARADRESTRRQKNENQKFDPVARFRRHRHLRSAQLSCFSGAAAAFAVAGHVRFFAGPCYVRYAAVSLHVVSACVLVVAVSRLSGVHPDNSAVRYTTTNTRAAC